MQSKYKPWKNYKIQEGVTSKIHKKGITEMKELGLTLKQTKGKVPVFVAVPNDVELIGFSSSLSDYAKISKSFEKVMRENPKMTFKQYRISKRQIK